MNMYQICTGCGNVFSRDFAPEKLRYNYKRTSRCPIPISPRCKGIVRWLEEDDAKKIPRKIVPICSLCNNEYTDPYLAESVTEEYCAHCYQRTQIKWVKKGCFIATTIMGNYEHPVVLELREFRDNWILEKKWGRSFVEWYYHYGVIAARVIKNSFLLKKICYLLIIKPLLYISRIVNHNKKSSASA